MLEITPLPRRRLSEGGSFKRRALSLLTKEVPAPGCQGALWRRILIGGQRRVRRPETAISNELAGAKDGDARRGVAGGVRISVSRLRSTAGRNRISGGTDPPAEERGTQPEKLGERPGGHLSGGGGARPCPEGSGELRAHCQ